MSICHVCVNIISSSDEATEHIVAIMTAPNSNQRRACWAARDVFWKCLDDSQDDATACEKFRTDFEANCPAQWVKYFVKRRDFLKYKEKIETKGYESSEQSSKL